MGQIHNSKATVRQKINILLARSENVPLFGWSRADGNGSFQIAKCDIRILDQAAHVGEWACFKAGCPKHRIAAENQFQAHAHDLILDTKN